MSETKFIPVTEAANRLDCTPHFIRKLLRENKIKWWHVAGQKFLQVDPASLENYQKSENYTTDISALKQQPQITIKEAVEDVEDYFKSDVISYIAIMGTPLSIINHDDCIILDDLLNNLEPKFPGKEKKFQKITLFIHSWWGILEAAIKFTEIIKHYAEDFDVIVPMMAKSAATLICLSATNIYLTTVSELWPVDPVVQSPLNPNIQVPARAIDDLIHFYAHDRKTITTGEKNDIDDILLQKIKDLDPYLLGSYKSALAFSETEIKQRLSEKISDNELLTKAVDEFTRKYASHWYPITYNKLQQFGLGKLIEDKKNLNAVKILLSAYQQFMAGNSIIKTIGNREMNRNIIIQQAKVNQVPTVTSI